MTRFRPWLLCGLFACMSCGGGGGGGSSSGGAGLSGTMNTANFLIPAGTTKTVTGNLKVLATGSIEIDGTLIVPPGVNVALISKGPLNIKGAIAPATTKASAPKTRDGAGGFGLTGFGTSVSVSGGVTTPLGTSVFIATNEAGTVSIDSITTSNGANSTAKSLPGANGGDIEVGTQNAIDSASQNGAENAQMPVVILVGTAITGVGGNGFADTIGVNDGTTLTAQGSKGGNGGEITMNASRSITLSGSIVAGNGGSGGACTITAPAQASPHKKGISALANSGDGGDGGSVTLSPAPTAGTIFAGTRGDPGSAHVSGGLGGSPGGDGGDATAIIGDAGKDGIGGRVLAPLPAMIYSVVAGNGAAATDPAEAGGNGGNAALTNKKGGQALLPAETPIINAGSGGAGGGGCGVKPVAGSNGGNVGKITVHGLAYAPATIKGGDGGDGEGPGAGGAPGSDDGGKVVGVPGNPGNFCGGGTGPTVFRTIKTTTTNPSFVSLDVSTAKIATTSADLNKTVFAEIDLNTGTCQSLTTPFGISDVNSSVANGNTSTRGSSVVYVSASSGSRVYIYNETTGLQSGSIPIPSGTGGPYGLAFDSTSGRLYVSTQDLKTFKGVVQVYDTLHSNALIGSISTDTVAYAMAVNPTNNRLYVGSYATMQLSVLDTSALTQIRTIILSDNSGVVSVNPKTGNVYVTLFNTSSLLEMSKDLDQTIATVKVGPSPWGIGIDTTRNRIYVANYNFSSSGPQQGTLMEVDGSTNTVRATVNVGKSPTGVAVDEAGDKIYVANGGSNTVSVLNGN